MFRFMNRIVQRRENRVAIRPPYAVQLEAFTLHQGLFVVDLHADSLLWNRDLLVRSRLGHVDLPRLLSGNVGLQVFGVVTRAPRGQNFYRTRARSDYITALAVTQGWPRRTWTSLFQRALYQAGKLRGFAERSGGRLVLVRTARDLKDLRDRRAAHEPVVGAFASLEGVHALQGRLENLDALYDAGFRMVGLTHFFDNAAGGSAHGMRKGGLTPFGADVVRRAQARHMLIDLAHASPQMIDDVLAITTAPVIVSHGGLRGMYDTPRNLSDDQLRRIAATGGVVGIALFKGALPAPRLDLAARAMRYAADVAGTGAVALGTDFDGVVEAPVDASGLPLLTEAMLSEGFTPSEIAQILGENAYRVLKQSLPQT